MELKLHYPGDQLDFWKLLVAKALEGPGLGAHGEFSKLLEKPLGTQFVGSLTSFFEGELIFNDVCSAGAEQKSVVFWGKCCKGHWHGGLLNGRNPAPLHLHQLRQIYGKKHANNGDFGHII